MKLPWGKSFSHRVAARAVRATFNPFKKNGCVVASVSEWSAQIYNNERSGMYIEGERLRLRRLLQ